MHTCSAIAQLTLKNRDLIENSVIHRCSVTLEVTVDGSIIYTAARFIRQSNVGCHVKVQNKDIHVLTQSVVI
jgi:hypothetical protein